MVDLVIGQPTENEDASFEPSESSQVPAVRSAMSLGSAAGEIEMSDLKIPYLSIAYGVGKLAEKFNPGDLVIGGENLIAKKNEKIRITLLSLAKHYKERLEPHAYSNGMRPRSFMTKEEVLKAGGTLDWVETERGRVGPSFGPALDTKILIQKPEGLDQSIFGIELEGGFYTAAYYSVDKSAYTRVGREILTQLSMALASSGLMSGVWELWTETQKINKNNTVVPMIKLVSRNTPEFIAAAEARFG